MVIFRLLTQAVWHDAMRRHLGPTALVLLWIVLSTAACELDSMLVDQPAAAASLALNLVPAGRAQADAQAGLANPSFALADLADQVRVRLMRDNTTVLDTTRTLTAGDGTISLVLPVTILGTDESLQLEVELQQGNQPLLRAERPVLLRVGQMTTVEVLLSPVEREPLAPVVRVSTGMFHSCALVADQTAYCWGRNDSGQLGEPALADPASSVPAPVSDDFALHAISAGYLSSCGLDSAGTAYCWGSNRYGELGNSSTNDSATPVVVGSGQDGRENFSVVVTTGPHACGLRANGTLRCWGNNEFGQLGDGTTLDRSAPVSVVGRLNFQTISVGALHTCGIDLEGRTFCWGYNEFGQLGDGTTLNRTSPVQASIEHRFQSVSAGGLHTCALDRTGQAYCWGHNVRGQAGNGTTVDAATPVAVSGSARFRSITAGGLHTCALTAKGEAYCWGYNARGALGSGDSSDRPTPTPVLGEVTFMAVHAGLHHTCATTTDQRAFCWGYNEFGQLGNGFTLDHTAPVVVVAPSGIEAQGVGEARPQADDPVAALLDLLGVR